MDLFLPCNPLHFTLTGSHPPPSPLSGILRWSNLIHLNTHTFIKQKKPKRRKELLWFILGGELEQKKSLVINISSPNIHINPPLNICSTFLARSHVHLSTTHHPRLCSTKARDNSSCEISICEINSCHQGSSDKPRPGDSEELEEVITPTHGKDKLAEVKVVKSSKLPAQQSVESTDSFTTTDTQAKQEGGSSQVPVATALFVATCLGTPAIALTGLKLGMFAAVGGGIMGFATGKMFAEHE